MTVYDVDRNHEHAHAHVHVHGWLADFDCDYAEVASDFVDLLLSIS